MKIIICSSIDFTPQIKEVADQLGKIGHEVTIPHSSEAILRGELTLAQYMAEKQNSGDGSFRARVERKIKNDVIREYYKMIADSDAVLILNLVKKGVEGYIGGNTLIEMGFAHVLNKPLYLWGNIPKMSYTDEIVAMQPTLISGDLSKIK